MDVYKPVYPGLYYFDTFTFTTLGTSGHRGPDSAKGYTDAPWRDGDFSIVNGQQQWTVPATGTYNIVAAGAYGATPGRVVSGDVDLYEGQVLTMLVGQQPTPLTANVADNVTVGGGGGTFVVSDGKPLIVASGGDGGVYSTGYLRSELLTENFQFRVSMSADGNVYAAIELNLITFQFTLKIYRYLSGVWTSEFTAPSIFTGVVLSGDGKTVAMPTSNSIAVYEYIDQIWQTPQYITNNDWDYITINIQISYDGNTIVAFIRDVASNWHLYVFTKNQDLTWNTEELSAPGNDTFTVYQSSSCAISGDGTRIFAAADDTSSWPNPTSVWSYSRTIDTWGLPELYTSLGVLRVESTSVSYDGQTVAIYVGNLQANPREGYLYVYENGNRTRNLTFPWTVQQYPAGAAQISYDGSLVLLIFITGKILVTPSTQITIFDDASGFPYPSGSINSTASRIVSPYYDVANPITYFFESGSSGQSGSFLPSGTGSGISGAGYLTDGQQTNPFFGFLKPKAYVNGGFGNSYEYGQPGVPKEGGFGGGQSPLNKQTDLTSVSGYNQFRPTIPLVSPGLSGMAISDDANTFLASFSVGNSGTAYTNVYTYNGTSWVSTNLYTTTFYGKSLAMSGDGSVWIINGDVWRNGSFEIQLQDFAYEDRGYGSTDISRDGNTAVIMYGQSGILKVYYYSGSWTSSVLFLQNPGTDYAVYSCAMSADGNTIAMSYNVPTYVFVNVYRCVDGTWSDPNQIFYQSTTSRNSISLNVDSDGSIITLSAGSSGNYQYSNGLLSKVDYRTYSVAFSRTDPKLYAWVDSTKVYVPSISLEVDVQVDPAGIDVMRMGSNVLAMSKILTPHAIVFLDMYDPTTTCTANTSVDHGYPHDYKVQITGTQYFNGTWDIVTTSSNTFTFQAFGGPTETSGYVSGTTTGISGGGGYTGSPGDGVSGATCYGVGTITDLGATSNHMGYVTVSLIDPAPIDLTLWSWDDESPWDNLDSFQSNVYTITWSESLGIFVTSGISAGICTSSNDAKKWYNRTIPWPYYTSPLVAADDKPILVLGRNTSSDGITWYLNDLPWSPYYYADVTNTVYVNKMFISTVAPDYYTPYNGIYTSTDGYAWTFISSELISVKAYGSSMYVGTTNTHSDPNIDEQVVYSTDLITWNYTSTYVYDLIFANGIFIGFNGDGSVISSDGISWTLYPYSFAFSWSYYPPPIRQIIFGNDLFMVVTARHVYTSPDGMNWTLTKIFSQNIDANISVTYSPSKQFFMFAPNAGVPVATLEGKYFTSLSEQIKYPVKGCAYSKGLNVLVVIARSYSYNSYSDDPIYIYTSSDNGETLLETSILYFGYQQPLQFEISILWSDEFYSFFIYFATNNSGLLIFTSSDGMTWTRQNDYVPEIPNYNLQGFNPVWYKEKNWFRYNSFYSYDGIIWSYLPYIPLPPSPPEYIGSKVWSPELELFVGTSKLNGISSSFDVYVSTDGINWSTVYTAFMSTVGFVGVVWSPELKRFYIYAAGYPTEADSLYLFESQNGYEWNKRVVPKVYTLDYARGFYWFSGFDRFVVQSFENFKGLTFSTKAIKQF